MKKLRLLLLIPMLLLTACGDSHHERGYVIEKNHTGAYNTIMITYVYTGKTLIPINHIIHHAETWSLDLKDEIEGKYHEYVVYLKDSSIWEEINVGDYFIWDEKTCYDCEPTTMERE